MKRTKSTHVFTVAAGVGFTLFVLIGVMFFAGFWTVGKTYTVSAYVSNARGIAQDSNVFIAGLQVGKVTGIRRNGPDAILSLQIDSGPTPLPVDSTVQLRLRSLAGEAYLQVYPGTSKHTIPNGGSLVLAQDQSYTEVDQILNQLQGSTAGATREFFQGLGDGLVGKGSQLNATLGSTASLINDSEPLTTILADQRTQVANIVQNFGNVMGAIGQRTQAVQQFAVGARKTFTAVSSRDVALKHLISDLPHAITSIRSAANAVETVTPHVAPVLTALGRTITKLSPTIHTLTPASQSGTQIIDALGAASPGLSNVLANLDTLKKPTAAAMPEVHALFCQLDPIIRYIKPYGPDISAVFENFGAVADNYDANNHEFPTSAVVNPESLVRGVTVQQTASIAPALDELLNLGVFGKIGATYGYDPNPGPGGDHNLTDGLNDTGATEYGLTHKYPHVTADCGAA